MAPRFFRFYFSILLIIIILFPLTRDASAALVGVSAADSAFDWREYGYDFLVKDQGVCNAGYAFAAVDAVQAAIWKKEGIKESFSVNNAKECNWNAENHHEAPPFYSCKGGDFKMLVNLFSQKGLVDENCDSYQPSDCDCNGNCAIKVYVTEWLAFSQGDKIADSSLIKEKLLAYGPLYTQMDANLSGFDSYSGNTVLSGGSSDPNEWTHGVLIIGWDNDKGGGAWLVKNSYGLNWGDEGYFWIAYGSAGIGSSLSAVKSWDQPSSHDERLYFLDEAGHTNNFAPNNDDWLSGTVMNLYTIQPGDIIRNIEFWTNDTALVRLKIYRSFDGNTTENLLYDSGEFQVESAGYHHVRVFKDLKLVGPAEIAVVMEIQNMRRNFPVIVDHLGGVSNNKSWYLDTDGRWQSLMSLSGGYDAGLRLRTFNLPNGLDYLYLPILIKGQD